MMAAVSGVREWKYILKDQEPVPVKDVLEWAQWMETHNRHVSKTEIDDILVSTVFLGMDHRDGMSRRPILFETMIFGYPRLEDYQERYCTWSQAFAGHTRAVDKLVEVVKAEGTEESKKLYARLKEVLGF